MDENGERDQLIDNDDNIRYEVNSNVINIFRISKSIYLLITILALGVVFVFDDAGYSDNLKYTTTLYIFVESLSLSTYMYKIKNTNRMRYCRIVSALLRICWIVVTIYGVYYWLQESKTDSSFYYVTGYVYISNMVFMFFSSLLTCFICCVGISIVRSENLDQQNRRAAISIIDDVSDIQIFSNVLKLNLYNDTVCSICLENFENNDRLRVLNCHHYFHDECIKTWFERSSKCPLCNKDMMDNDESAIV